MVDIGGSKVITGGNALATGPVDPTRLPTIIANLTEQGFSTLTQDSSSSIPPPFEMDRSRYADAYGPTVGDRVRLGDLSLFIEIEKDFTVYGEECVFGGGKVIREGMGQATGVRDDASLDLVITNAVIVDWSGIYKVRAL